MDTRVVGVTSEDDPTYQKHLKVWNACEEAGVEIPDETSAYFNHDNPRERLRVEIPVIHAPYDTTDAWEVVVATIPEGVERIVFENSY